MKPLWVPARREIHHGKSLGLKFRVGEGFFSVPSAISQALFSSFQHCLSAEIEGQTMDRDERFVMLWTKSQQTVAGYIHSLVPDHAKADDLLQEVALVLFKKLDQFEEGRPFTPWAIGIAKNFILMDRRSYARSKIKFSNEMVDILAQSYEGMVDEMDHRIEALRKCMKVLSAIQTKVLKLQYVKSLSTEEIALQIGKAPVATRVLLSRCKAKVRECITSRLQQEGDLA